MINIHRRRRQPEEKCMSYTLAVGMQAHVKVSYVDAGGNPAVVDGDVTWASSDDAVAAVFVSSNDTSEAVIRPVGPIGNVQITATADADLGAGVREIITPMDLTIVAGEAMSGTIAPTGPAEPIP
jgi:hypothetical protein